MTCQWKLSAPDVAQKESSEFKSLNPSLKESEKPKVKVTSTCQWSRRTRLFARPHSLPVDVPFFNNVPAKSEPNEEDGDCWLLQRPREIPCNSQSGAWRAQQCISRAPRYSATNYELRPTSDYYPRPQSAVCSRSAVGRPLSCSGSNLSC